MTIDTVEITEEQRDKILQIKEGHFQDIKAIEMKPAKLTKTISAFANASGGELYIGIDESIVNGKKVRNWRGFSDQEAANGHIQAFEQFFPLGQYFSCNFLKCAGADGFVLQGNINKTQVVTRALDGIPYVRRGAQNLPVKTPEALARLELDKGITSFENETIDVPLPLVTNSVIILKFLLEVIPTAEPEPCLKKQILVRNSKPTVAAIMLFSEEPQAILPKRSGIKIYRYKTVEAEGTRETLAFDPISIEGSLYDQIKASVQKTVELVEGIKILGAKGLEEIKYPFVALHEIITNAVLHRDYSIASDIHVRIFDNRVEIENPGKLPGHITEKNILHEQFARNGSLVRLINKFPDPPNKDVGEGLNTAFEAMRSLRLKVPIIKEKENSVVVYIRHERLASPEETVMEYLSEHDQINNRTARQLTGIDSENTMKDVFYRLRDKQLIERVPGKKGRSSAWQLKGSNELFTIVREV